MALLLLPTKFILMGLVMLAFTISMVLVTIGHDFEKGPIRGRTRKGCLNFWNTTIPTIFAYVFCVRLQKKTYNLDYEEYLGNQEDTEIGQRESV